METFAATPQSEMLKVLVNRCVTASHGGEIGFKHKGIMINDVKIAYFYANVRSEIYVEIPAEYKTAEDE